MRPLPLRRVVPKIKSVYPRASAAMYAEGVSANGWYDPAVVGFKPQASFNALQLKPTPYGYGIQPQYNNSSYQFGVGNPTFDLDGFSSSVTAVWTVFVESCGTHTGPSFRASVVEGAAGNRFFLFVSNLGLSVHTPESLNYVLLTPEECEGKLVTVGFSLCDTDSVVYVDGVEKLRASHPSRAWSALTFQIFGLYGLGGSGIEAVVYAMQGAIWFHKGYDTFAKQLSVGPDALWEPETNFELLSVDSGGPATYDLGGSPSSSATTSSSAAVSLLADLGAAVSIANSVSSTGALQRSITLIGGGVASTAESSASPLQRIIPLSPATSVQQNATSTNGLSRIMQLYGAPSSQSASSAVAALGGSNELAGAPSSQASSSSTGAITRLINLQGSTSDQPGFSSNGALFSGNDLAATPSLQTASSSVGSVQRIIQLAGAPCNQAQVSTGGMSVRVIPLVAQPSYQDSIASSAAIVRVLNLIGSPCVQAAASLAVAFGGDELTPQQITELETLVGIELSSSPTVSALAIGLSSILTPAQISSLINALGGNQVGASEIADAVLAKLLTANIPVDVKRVNGTALSGTGLPGNEWGPA